MYSRIKKNIFNILHQLTRKLLLKNNLIGVPIGKILQLFTKGKHRIVKMDYFNAHTTRKDIKKEYFGYVFKTTKIDEKVKKVAKTYASLGYNIIDNGFVDIISPFVRINNTIYKQKYYSPHNDKRVAYNTHLIIETTKNYAYISMFKPPINIDKGIHFGGSWATNWYHWLIEILPKVEIYQYLPKEYKNYPILLPKDIEKSKNHIAILKHLFPHNNFIYLNKTNWYKIKKVVWLDSSVICSPNFKFRRNDLTLLDTNFDWELMANFKSRIIKKIEISLPPQKNRRLFLARPQTRRKYNQEEVGSMLKKYHFETVYLENYTIEEQIKILQSATFITGQSGAAWANLLFCNRNTQALIWMPDFITNANIYANLAQLNGINLIHYYYPVAKEMDLLEFYATKEKTILAIDKLEKIIIKMLSNNN